MMMHKAKILLWAAGVLTLLFCLSIPCDQTVAQQPATSDLERQELEVYRKYVPDLIKELDQAKSSQNAPVSPEIQAYRQYLVKYYEQQAELQTIRA